MPLYQYKCEQKVKATRDELWDFISSPANLKEITPDYMGFDITSEGLPDKMYTGMIITYKVSPLLGLKLNWVTEITHVEDGKFFIDEQRVGPYNIWHHQHHIQEIPGGMAMQDIVSYKPPMGPLGAIANTLMIRKKLEEIFDYRQVAIDNRFGKYTEH
jgi:ligand-binding SRPBCC domain-containing protein